MKIKATDQNDWKTTTATGRLRSWAPRAQMALDALRAWQVPPAKRLDTGTSFHLGTARQMALDALREYLRKSLPGTDG